jgi:hypothetical protein
MSALLLVLGIVVAAAGVATIGFGIPINEFTLGTTLILAGTTALTGGLIVIGLSAVVGEISRLVEGTVRPTAQPSPRQLGIEPAHPMATATGSPLPPPPVTVGPRPAVVPPMPARPRTEEPIPREPRPMPPSFAPAPSSVEVSSAAIERLRSSIPRADAPKAEPPAITDVEPVPLTPNGGTPPPAPPASRPAEDMPTEPKVTAEDRSPAGAVETLKASRLDFLFRSKQPRPVPQPENFDSYWPAGSRTSRTGATPSPPKVDQPQPQQAEPAPAAPADTRRSDITASTEIAKPEILKSGVVDGMGYTLYADGSIEAKLPQGIVRFNSIAELRAHIESSS